MNFTITNRIIDTENDENIISYNTDYIANFSFDEEWEGTVKTARFIQNGAHEDKVLVNDSCEIPSLKNGVVRIGVFNDTMTSTYKLLKVRNSIKDDSGNPAEPEPDVYAQLISLIQSGMLKGKDGYTPVKGTDYFTEEEVEAIIGEADVFSQKAGESATAAAKSEQNATLSERNALSSEQSAKKSEENVSKSEQAAEQSASNAATSASGAKTSETAAAASAKSAADSASAAEKSKSDAQTLVDNFGRTVEEATTGAVSTVNDTKDNAVNEVNALLDTIPEDYTAMAEDVDCLKSDLGELEDSISYSTRKKGYRVIQEAYEKFKVITGLNLKAGYEYVIRARLDQPARSNITLNIRNSDGSFSYYYTIKTGETSIEYVLISDTDYSDVYVTESTNSNSIGLTVYIDFESFSNIDKVNKLVDSSFKKYDIVYNDGYLDNNGNFNSQSSDKRELYTDKLSVSSGDIIRWEYHVDGTTKRELWISYLLYDKNGNLIGNRVVDGMQESVIACGYITIPENVSYIVLNCRSYGTQNPITVNGFSFNPSLLKKVEDNKIAIEDNKIAIEDNKIAIEDNKEQYLYKMKSCYDHLFVNNSDDAITIPHESLFHVRLSRKMGFNVIEANIASTSDGVFIVNHLQNGTFARYFHHVDNTTDISQISVSSVTWDWIVNNVRYNSTIEKYRTRPCRLEEFLSECRQQNIIPFIYSSNTNVMKIADKYMGKGNYIAYGATRSECPNGIIYHWVTGSVTKESILNYCESIGKPFIYGISDPSAFSDEELREITNAVHEKGYAIGSSYIDGDWWKYSFLGIDFNGTTGRINRIDYGNICNIDTVLDFSDFVYNVSNTHLDEGNLVFDDDEWLRPNITDESYSVCGVDIQISFVGKIRIYAVGEMMANTTIESDGTIPYFACIPIINGSPKIKMLVYNGTRISDISFKASKF